MLFSEFFSPVKLDQIPYTPSPRAYSHFIKDLGGYAQDMQGLKLALMGMEDQAADCLRQEWYKLMSHADQMDWADLGNLHAEEPQSIHYALRETCSYLLDEKIIPVYISTQDIGLSAMYEAYESWHSRISVTSIDADIDLRERDEPPFLWKIIAHKPNYLFNICQLGYQSYMVEPETIKAMQSMYFDAHRLGWVKSHMEETEAIFRSTDLLTINMRAIRYSDNPAQTDPSPNGFFGDEMCRMMRYAGMSSKVTAIAIIGYEPELDQQGCGARLLAQMLWYFHEGVQLRVKENPEESPQDFFKFVVGLKENELSANFYKSKRSERWWMEVPTEFMRPGADMPHLIPCSYEDYQASMRGEIPERWWNMYQKLV